MASSTVHVEWNEDGSATIYGRLVSFDATGTAVPNEGKCIRQADLVPTSGLSWKSYDDAEPAVSILEGNIPISGAIFDTLQTQANDPAWPFQRGFNFRHTLAPANFPTGDRIVVVEVTFVTTGGTVGRANYIGPVRRVHGS